MTRPLGATFLRRYVALLAVGLPVLACGEGTVVHQETSAFNRLLVLERPEGLRELKFADASAPSQSVVKVGQPRVLELAYTKGTMAGLAYVPNPRRILVIGVGGGSIPMFLRTTTDARIDAVDIDPAVIRVAKEWFGFRPDGHLRTHVADGRRFIEAAAPQTYDLMILDAYDADAVPSSLWTREFLETVKSRLRPGGAVIANIWRRPNALYGDMLRTFHAVYPKFDRYELQSSGNEIFVGFVGERLPAKRVLVERARRIQRDASYPFDLAGLLTYGLRRPGAYGHEGNVLEDADVGVSPR